MRKDYLQVLWLSKVHEFAFPELVLQDVGTLYLAKSSECSDSSDNAWWLRLGAQCSTAGAPGLRALASLLLRGARARGNVNVSYLLCAVEKSVKETSPSQHLKHLETFL